MTSVPWHLAVFLAQAENNPSPLLTFAPIVVILLLWIFLIQRPQKREQQTRQQMLAALKKNDRVLTTGGIIGVVTNVVPEAREVTVRIDDSNNTRVRMTLGAIARVLGEDESAGTGETN